MLHADLPIGGLLRPLRDPFPVACRLQELALSSKPGLLAAIEELEKMTAGLKEALKEELGTTAAEARTAALAEAEAGKLGESSGNAGRVAAAARAGAVGGTASSSTKFETVWHSDACWRALTMLAIAWS